MKNRVKFTIVLSFLMLISFCLVLTGCANDNKALSLSNVLEKLQNNTGNFTITGTGNLDNDNLNYHRQVDLIYKVDGLYSYAYDKNDTLHNQTETWYNEWVLFFNGEDYNTYYRTRTETTLWSKCDFQITTIANAFLSDADFRQISEDMFTKNDINTYTLNGEINLNPYWDNWINKLTYLKIQTNEDGATIKFKGSGNINTTTSVNAEFNFNVIFNKTNFAKPTWAKAPSYYNLFINTSGKGSVFGSGLIKEGGSVTITATPSTNYYFYGWRIGTQLITESSYTFTMPSNNLTITAIFYEMPQYTIRLTKTSGGWINGSIVLTELLTTKSESFHVDELVSLHANASYGYKFVGWYVGGQFFSSDATLAFYMLERDFSIEARFIAK